MSLWSWFCCLTVIISINTTVWSKTCCKPISRSQRRSLNRDLTNADKRQCKRTTNPATCGNNANCVWNCHCGDDMFSDIIADVTFQGMASELYAWNKPIKLKNNIKPKDKKNLHVTDEEYVKSTYITAIEYIDDKKDAVVYKLTLDPSKFDLKSEQNPIQKPKPAPVLARRLIMSDVTGVEINSRPYNATGIIQAKKTVYINKTLSRIHSWTGTAAVIQSYQSGERTDGGGTKTGKFFRKLLKPWYSWLLTAGHNLMVDKGDLTNGNILDLSLFKFYRELDDTSTASISKSASLKKAICVYVTHYVNNRDQDNDWALMKFKGKSKSQLKIAYDDNIPAAGWNAIVPTYYVPGTGRAVIGGLTPNYEMRKLNFNMVPDGTCCLKQTTVIVYHGMSGSPMVRDDADDNKIYGVVINGYINRAGASIAGGQMSRITRAKYMIITDLIAGLDTGTGRNAGDTSGNTAKLSYYDEYIGDNDEYVEGEDNFDDYIDVYQYENWQNEGASVMVYEFFEMTMVVLSVVVVITAFVFGLLCGFITAKAQPFEHLINEIKM